MNVGGFELVLPPKLDAPCTGECLAGVKPHEQRWCGAARHDDLQRVADMAFASGQP